MRLPLALLLTILPGTFGVADRSNTSALRTGNESDRKDGSASDIDATASGADRSNTSSLRAGSARAPEDGSASDINASASSANDSTTSVFPACNASALKGASIVDVTMAPSSKSGPPTPLTRLSAALGLPKAGVYRIFSNYGAWREPDSANATMLTWSMAEDAWPPQGVEVGRGVLDLQYYHLTRAELTRPRHATMGSSEGGLRPELELTLHHAWVNASAAVGHALSAMTSYLADPENLESLAANSSNASEMQAELVKLHRDRRQVQIQESLSETAASKQRLHSQSHLQALVQEDAKLRKREDVEKKIRGAMRAQVMTCEASFKRLQKLQDRAAEVQALVGHEEDALSVETLEQATKALVSADEAWRPPGQKSTEMVHRTVDGLKSLASMLDERKAKLAGFKKEIAASLDAQDLPGAQALGKRREEYKKRWKQRYSARRATLKADAATLASWLERQTKGKPVNITARLTDKTPWLVEPIIRQRQCSAVPMNDGCLPGSRKTNLRLKTLEEQMLQLAWALAASSKGPLKMIVPLVASNASKLQTPAMLERFVFLNRNRTPSEPLWQLPGGESRGYAPLPLAGTSGWHGTGAEMHIVTKPLKVPQSWLDDVLPHIHEAAAAEQKLMLQPGDIQPVMVRSEKADDIYMAKAPGERQRDFLVFKVICGACCASVAIFALAVEVVLKRGSGTEWSMMQLCVKTGLDGKRQNLEDAVKVTYVVLSTGLLVLHTALLIGIPLIGMGEARCLDGYDWRKHDAYAAFQCLSRLVEVYFYWRMGGLGCGLCFVFFKLTMGVAGGLDFYTDITFAVIAKLCEGSVTVAGIDVWLASALLFGFSVIVMQVLVPTCLAVFRPQQRVILLMRLNQHELLQEYYNPHTTSRTLVDDERTDAGGFQKFKSVIAFILTIVRFTMEDLPQMWLQYRFKSSLPNTGMIWFSLGVGLFAGGGGLLASLYDVCKNINQVWKEDEAESKVGVSETLGNLLWPFARALLRIPESLFLPFIMFDEQFFAYGIMIVGGPTMLFNVIALVAVIFHFYRVWVCYLLGLLWLIPVAGYGFILYIVGFRIYDNRYDNRRWDPVVSGGRASWDKVQEYDRIDIDGHKGARAIPMILLGMFVLLPLVFSAIANWAMHWAAGDEWTNANWLEKFAFGMAPLVSHSVAIAILWVLARIWYYLLA